MQSNQENVPKNPQIRELEQVFKLFDKNGDGASM